MKFRWLSRRTVIAAVLAALLASGAIAVMNADRWGREDWIVRYSGRRHRVWYIAWRRVQVVVGNPHDDDWNQFTINVK